MDKVYTPHWINLDKEIREHLRKVFSVARSGITEVRDQTLISDGTTNDDLAKAFTIESLCNYVGSKETFARAWEIAVSKAKYEVNPPINLPVMEPIDPNPSANPSAPITDPALLLPAPTEVKFCDLCDSKGLRHQKECTKPGLVNGFERQLATTPNAQV